MEQVAPTLLVVIVVIPVGDRFVLVEEAKEVCRGKWALPGGVVESGESLAAAAVRESREEAGLTVAPRGILGVEQVIYPDTGTHPYRQKLRFIMVADVVSGTLKSAPDKESLRAGLWSRPEIRSLVLREPRYAEWLDSYQSGQPLLPVTAVHYQG